MKGIQGGTQPVRMTYRMSSSSDNRFVSLNLSFTEWIVQALALDDDFDVLVGISEVWCQYGTNNNVKVIRDEDDYQNEFLPCAREAGSIRVKLYYSVSCIPSYNIIMLTLADHQNCSWKSSSWHPYCGI